MSAHTPGPWVWSEGMLWNEKLDSVVLNHAGCEWPVREANRDLISAAPEMLDSLKHMAEALNVARFVMKEQETRDLAGALVADARSVIARAEGR